jgi:hypothetical protein
MLPASQCRRAQLHDQRRQHLLHRKRHPAAAAAGLGGDAAPKVSGRRSVGFVLYRNVFDRYQVGDRYYTLLPFLSDVLLKDNKQNIFELSVDRGVRVVQGSSPQGKAELYRISKARDWPAFSNRSNGRCSSSARARC